MIWKPYKEKKQNDLCGDVTKIVIKKFLPIFSINFSDYCDNILQAIKYKTFKLLIFCLLGYSCLSRKAYRTYVLNTIKPN